MLAKIAAPHASFTNLARYLIHDTQGDGRVAWFASRNLPSADPLVAAKVMTATAKLSRRTQKPLYHAVIAWHADEAPTPEEMESVAGQTLDLMGLVEHQTLIVGHGDTEHPHLHMMINRVHPVTGRAWKTAHDFLRFDRCMKQLADAYGFEYVPARRFNLDDETFAASGRSKKASNPTAEPMPLHSRPKSARALRSATALTPLPEYTPFRFKHRKGASQQPDRGR